MSMSDAFEAMPSSRILAPSLTSANTRRSTISSSEILRRVSPSAFECSTIMSLTCWFGYGLRSPGL
ncbi:hypothetical protein D3C86_1908460 [compost metagenome]